MRFKLTMLLTALLTAHLTLPAAACTRAVYKGPEQTIITARSMDWKDEIPANLWLFPRGIERQGEVGANSVRWTAKYGSVLASVFSVIRNALVPFGISSEAEPNISSTRWPRLSRPSRLCLPDSKTSKHRRRSGTGAC